MENSKVYKSFTDLDVWKMSRIYKNEIAALVNFLPPIEKYRLEDQLIRASRSIGSNISEGYGRYTYKTKYTFAYKQEALYLNLLIIL